MMHQIPAVIFMIPFTSALILPFFKKNHTASQILSVTSLTALSALSIYGLFRVRDGSVVVYSMGGWPVPYGIEWRFDALSAVMCVLISLVSLIVVIGTGENVKTEIGAARIPFHMTVLLLISGLLGMALTHDLFNLFVFLEVASLTAYALIASGDRVRSNVSSLRYLFIGTVGASFYLLGVGYLYAMTGTLNMSDMALRLGEVAQTRSVFLGLLLILIGLAIKSGLFPFHGWLPDAYAFSSNPAAAVIAPIMTKVSIYAFIRIFFTFFEMSTPTMWVLSRLLLSLGALAVIAGSLFAFMQKRFRRMLAYSSISHIGLIMIGVGLNDSYALIGALLHIVNHAVMKTALFLTANSVSLKHGITDISDFPKLRSRMPYTSRTFALAALSMTGVPPLCGFFSKWYILLGAFRSGHFLIALLVVFSSLLTALYFFKSIEQIFFQKQEKAETIDEAPLTLVYSFGFLSVALIGLGFFAPSIFSWALTVLLPIGS